MKPLRMIPLLRMIPPAKLRRPRELRPVEPSNAGTVALQRILTRLVRKLSERARGELLQSVHHERQALGLADAAGDETRNAVARLRRFAETDADEAAEEAEEELRREAERHGRRWVATVRAGVGVDIAPLIAIDDVGDVLSVRAIAAAELIRSISGETVDKVAQAALRGIYGGGTDEVAREIQAAMGIGFRRARLIGRDQMAKLNSEMNEYRQREIGVERYKWKTTLDGRERPHHHARNNKVYAWDEPPSGGHPGREVNCRCRALAVIVLPGE
jgi:SPP1 gp7 family putative phage head morphogenesis protein